MSKTYNEKKIFLFGTIIVIMSILLISFSYEILFNIQFSIIFPNVAKLILSYYIIGAILKFADDSFDEGRFSKKLSVLLIILGFVIAVWLSYNDKTTAIIFLSLVLATTLVGKTIDTPFLVGSITYIGTIIYFDILNELNIIIFAIIFGALIVDELFAEWAKKVLRYNNNNYNDTIIYFLRDRNIGIFILFFLAAAGQIPFVNWLAWVFLDFGYIMVEGISRKDNIDIILLRKVFVADNNNITQKEKTDIVTYVKPRRTDVITGITPGTDVITGITPGTYTMADVKPKRTDVVTGIIPGTDVIVGITPETDVMAYIKPQRADIMTGIIPGTDVMIGIAPEADVMEDVKPQRTDIMTDVKSRKTDIMAGITPGTDVMEDEINRR